MKDLILASASPRRQELIKKLHIPFTVDVSNFEEYFDMDKTPAELVLELSLGKARMVAERHSGSIILAADTFVVLEGKYLGKPKSREDAFAMLSFQSGKRQDVITGFTLIDTETDKTVSKAVVSHVFIKKLSKEEINAYLDRNTYMDKAGSYAIQEVRDTFIEKIEGDYDNIVGFPVEAIRQELQDFIQ